MMAIRSVLAAMLIAAAASPQGAAVARGARSPHAGSFAVAARLWQQPLGLAPTWAWARRARAAVRFGRGDLDGARADLDLVLRLAPGDVVARAWRGLVRLRSGDLDGAAEDEREALRLAPKLGTAWSGLGWIAESRGDDATALRCYDAWVEAQPDRAEAWSARARIECRRADFAAAVRDLQQAVRIAPDDLQARAALAAELMNAHETSAALRQYDAAIALSPDDAELYCERANARMLAGDDAGATEDEQRASELRPDLSEPRLQLAWLAQRRGDVVEARLCYDELLLRSPLSVDALLSRGQLLSELGCVHDALVDLDRAVRLAPDRWDIYEARATTRLRGQDYSGALADISEVIVREPDRLAAYSTRAYLRRWRTGDYAGAAADASTILDVRPDDLGALRVRADARRLAGDLVSAVADYQTLLGFDAAQSFVAVFDATELGWLQLRLQRPAAAAFDRAWNALDEAGVPSESPIVASVLCGRARALVALGRPRDAACTFEDSPRARRCVAAFVRARLEQIRVDARLGDLEAALEHLCQLDGARNVEERPPSDHDDDAAWAALLDAGVSLTRRDLEHAALAVNRALDERSCSVVAHVVRARVLRDADAAGDAVLELWAAAREVGPRVRMDAGDLLATLRRTDSTPRAGALFGLVVPSGR